MCWGGNSDEAEAYFVFCYRGPLWTMHGIVATTGVNWLTWGEVISFQMESVDEQRWKIEIDSRPALPTTVIDYEKVERIYPKY